MGIDGLLGDTMARQRGATSQTRRAVYIALRQVPAGAGMALTVSMENYRADLSQCEGRLHFVLGKGIRIFNVYSSIEGMEYLAITWVMVNKAYCG